ncbi:uncharacterized protein EI90DRAFT_2976948 [Cantharellus anzutake]|uniref:uncharacterized protein n=1 Tax=Cantharellus anzutake TaxID=1750568 RepID=UPI001903C85E|nr:uncharacterized protein EI90DRAFT_2976948 [Cantharellus anzutake]KAF8324556.1 hypothetical protein EI90DRAFT_2976948 [Cantharellus anzutake]
MPAVPGPRGDPSFGDSRSPFSEKSLRAYVRASKSFDNLIALANDRERWDNMKAGAKKVMWRDVGEPPIPIDNFQECLEHALRGGIRAGLLAGAIRAGVNIFLLLFKILRKPKSFRTPLVLRALFGTDTLRFGAMLASFAFIYKFILNALPLTPVPDRLVILRSKKKLLDMEATLETPDDNLSTGQQTPLTIHSKKHPESKRGHLSLHSEIVYSRLDGARWHAVLAGALAGLSVLWEKKSRRITIAQQIFVRGLQGVWNAWSPRLGIEMPFGPVIVFSLACGQIMYAFLLRPETIPQSYNDWILRASKVWPETMEINRELVRNGKFDLPKFKTLLSRPGNTKRNQEALNNIWEHAVKGDFMGRQNGTCQMIHPWLDSCIRVEIERFVSVWTWMFPIYGALHFIPMILFKRRLFMKEPLAMLLKSLKGTMRSSTFLGIFVNIYQSILCAKNKLYDSQWAANNLSPQMRSVLISRFSFWLLGAMCALALFIEESRRRAELAMYVLPKGLESAWSMMRNRGYVPFIPWGESVLSAVAMGMVMSTYQNDPHHLSGLVRRVLYQFIGPN